MIRSIRDKNLSQSTHYKVKRMIKAILAESQLFNQEQYCGLDDGDICRQASCAGGWAIWLENPKMFMRMARQDRRGEPVDWPKIAAAALDLDCDSPDELMALFGCSALFPAPFANRYSGAKTNKERAQVTADRWLKFLETDGNV